MFVSVASKRSFVEAARTLSRSPQSVTRAVAAIERRLGTRLLNRTTRSVALTSEGEAHLERARALVADADALENPADAAAPLTGRLSVTAPVLFGQLHVAPVVYEFLRQHPELDARLVLLDRVVSLVDEGLDLGVRIGALPDSSLRARVVGHVRSVVCASRRICAEPVSREHPRRCRSTAASHSRAPLRSPTAGPSTSTAASGR
ncbi:MAG: LysR substrate-binding domain-containing protein [Myxococcaceae bacterium]